MSDGDVNAMILRFLQKHLPLLVVGLYLQNVNLT